MKKIYFLLMSALVAYCGNTVAAQDVYVYKGESLTPVSTLKNVQKITFGDASVDFLLDSGESTQFTLDALDYFLFYDRAQVVGITEATAVSGISVACNGDVVSVESTETLTGVGIYSIEGVKIAAVKPTGKNATYSLAGSPDGVYLVKVEAGGKTVTQKVIKK